MHVALQNVAFASEECSKCTSHNFRGVRVVLLKFGSGLGNELSSGSGSGRLVR